MQQHHYLQQPQSQFLASQAARLQGKASHTGAHWASKPVQWHLKEPGGPACLTARRSTSLEHVLHAEASLPLACTPQRQVPQDASC